MTPLDYDFLRKGLKQHSGLVLAADKHYLVESRLLPLARMRGSATWPNWSKRSEPGATLPSWPASLKR